MQSAVLLRCPICNAVQALEGRRNEYAKQSIYHAAKTHVRNHNLNEPKTAIQKYGIMADAVEIVVSPDNYSRLPIREWKNREDTWLPEGALPDRDVSLQSSDSSV